VKIDRSNAALPNASLGSAATQNSKASESVASARVATAPVQISGQVLALGAAASSPAASFDAKKVQDIRTAIAEGRFEVNAEHVADGLLSTVRDLIRSHTRSA
jgi:negative regulator of flagellin synthesis FlgM